MKKVTIVKEFTDKRTATSREYLLSDGQHRIVQTLAANMPTKRSAVFQSASVAEDSVVDYSVYQLDTAETSSSGYNVGVYYDQMYLALEIMVRQTDASATVNSVKLRARRVDYFGSESTMSLYRGADGIIPYPDRLTDLAETSENGNRYVEVELWQFMNANPTLANWFSIFLKNQNYIGMINILDYPELIVDYIPGEETVTTHDVDHKQSYIEGEVGKAGAYKVNTRTGRMDFTRNLLSLDGEKMPMNLSVTYNPYFKYGDVTPLLSDWKFNIEQYVYEFRGKYFYVDGSFRQHIFEPLGGDKYYDTDHTGLILTAGSGNNATITDGRNFTMTFTGGKLTKISEQNGKEAIETSISYGSNVITVTDGCGRNAVITKSGNYVTVKKPDQNTITITYSSNYMSITDGSENSVYSFGTKDGVKLLTSAGTDQGQSILFDYFDSVLTKKVDEIVNGKTVKRYKMVYGLYHTDVDIANYPASASDTSQKVRYIFSEKNETLSRFEIKDDKPYSVSFASEKDYNKYVFVMRGDYATCADMTVTRDTFSQSQFGKIPWLGDGEKFVLSAEIERVLPSEASAADYPDTFDLHIACGALTAPGDMYEVFADNVKVRNFHGIQPVILNVGYISEIEGADILGCRITTDAGITFKVRNIRMIANPVNDVTYCVNKPTGVSVSYTERGGSGTSWCELCDCTVGNATEPVTMSKTDWLATLESYARNKDNFYVWSNELSVCRQGNASTAFKFANDLSYNISELRFATVTKQNTRTVYEYNTYGEIGSITAAGGNTYASASGVCYASNAEANGVYSVVTTLNTVYADNSNKACYLRYDNYYRLKESENSEGAVITYAYDDYGNVTGETVTADGKSIVGNSAYGNADGTGATGKYLIRETDYLTGRTFARNYTYKDSTGELLTDRSPKNQTTTYAYLSDGNPASVSAAVDGENNINSYGYDAKGRLLTLTHNGMAHTFVYNDYNEVEKVTVNGVAILDKTYTHSSSEDTTELIPGPNMKTTRKYDAYGRLTEIDCEENNGAAANQKNIYGAIDDDVTDVTDPLDNRLTKNAESKLRKRIDNGRKTIYNYDNKGNLTELSRDDGMTVTYTYDADGRAGTQVIALVGANDVELEVTYKDGDALNGDSAKASVLSMGNYAGSAEDTADKFGRLDNRTRGFGAKGTLYSVGINESFGYAEGNGADTTTEKVCAVERTLRYFNGNSTAENDLPTESFAYDGNGNFESVTCGEDAIRYRYDGLNRLIREDNAKFGKTWTYGYDEGGNIQWKKEYALTPAANDPAGEERTYNYAYDDSFHDVLTGWNGYQINSVLGYPVQYKGNALQWSNRKLYRYGGTTFTYDADNVRYTKTSGSTTTTYYYEGSRLLAEKRVTGNSTTNVQYLYDHTGLTGFKVENNTYLYEKNLQGDITGIYDMNGTAVAKYAYDAWGVCKTLTNVGGMANTNPFRYRGYYYDAETNLYYLINRYYDPEIGRFISPDHIGYMMEQMDRLNGCNLYAYCLNNPVMETDPEGTFISLLIGLVVSAVIGFTSSVISQGIEYGWENINYGQAVVDGLFAVGSTALAATGIGFIASTALGAGMGFAQYAIDSAFHGEEITLGGALISTGLGALGGMLSGCGARNPKNILSNLSGRAKSGLQALKTTAQKFGAFSPQMTKVANLYGGAINTSIQLSIKRAFTKSAGIIWGLTAFLPFVSFGLNRLLD